MISPPHLLRVTSLLVSASWNLMSEDPRGFLRKISERVRQSDNPVLSAIPTKLLSSLADTPVSEARKLINAGHLTAGVQHVVNMGPAASHSDIHLAKRTLERIEQLTTPPSVVKGGKLPSVGEHRVLHLLTNSKPFTQSGYTVRSHEVLKCQQAAGIEAQAVTRLGYPVLVGKIPKGAQQLIDKVPYRRLLPDWYPLRLADRNSLAVEMVVVEARMFGATILHTTTDYTNAMVVAQAAKRLGIPWVYEIRGELESTWLARQPKDRQAESEASEFYRLARNQETRYMVSADAVVALSEVSKRELADRGIPVTKISVVPNAVDGTLIGRQFDRKSVRRELGLAEDNILIGTVTAVVDYEGLDTLIDAMPFLPDRYMAVIVGDGSAKPELVKRAEKLGVADRIKFAGRQPNEDIWRWYAALDVFVVPRRDTKVTRTVTPIKPLVAMALDVPVVASDLPALREVTGGHAEYVCPEDPQALSRGIMAASITEPGGSEWILSRTWSKNGQRYRDLYNYVTNFRAD